MSGSHTMAFMHPMINDSHLLLTIQKLLLDLGYFVELQDINPLCGNSLILSHNRRSYCHAVTFDYYVKFKR